jgi:hypothetical protein
MVDEGRNFTTRLMRARPGAQFPVRTGMLRQFKADHPQRHLCPEACMTDKKFLTPEEVSERYRGEVTVGTLRNWRAMRIGPAFVKIGKQFCTRLMSSMLGIRKTWLPAVRHDDRLGRVVIKRDDHG